MENPMISQILYLSLPDIITGTNLTTRLQKYITGGDCQKQSYNIDKNFTSIFLTENVDQRMAWIQFTSYYALDG